MKWITNKLKIQYLRIFSTIIIVGINPQSRSISPSLLPLYSVKQNDVSGGYFKYFNTIFVYLEGTLLSHHISDVVLVLPWSDSLLNSLDCGSKIDISFGASISTCILCKQHYFLYAKNLLILLSLKNDELTPEFMWQRYCVFRYI